MTRKTYRDRVKGLARLPASRIEPEAKNFRTHDERQRGVVRGLLAELGAISGPIVWVPDKRAREALRKVAVGDPAGFAAWLAAFTGSVRLIDGHLRREELAAQDIQVQVTDLDGPEAAKALATFDAVSDLAGVDAGLLASLLGDIGEATEAGVTDLLGELRKLIPTAKTTGDDDVEEPNEGPFDSVIGGVYQLGPHVLVCGDSTDPTVVGRALDGAAPRLWFVDPPFDLQYEAWPLLPSIDVVAVWHRSKSAFLWMAQTFAADAWGPHSLVFTGGIRGQHNHTLPACMHDNVTVWRRTWWDDKLDAIDREVIRASGCAKTVDDRPISWQEKVGGVFTNAAMSWGKPVLESEIVAAYVSPGSHAVDTCAGSGSTLIACAKHGRIWHGIELLPKWCDLIRRRWMRWANENGIEPGKGGLRAAEVGSGPRPSRSARRARIQAASPPAPARASRHA